MRRLSVCNKVVAGQVAFLHPVRCVWTHHKSMRLRTHPWYGQANFAAGKVSLCWRKVLQRDACQASEQIFLRLAWITRALTPAVRCAEGKRISPAAWEMLSAQHGNPPALTSDSLCRECLGQQLERATQGRRGDELREEMLEIAIRLLDGSSSAASDFLISKSWLL